MTKNFNTGSKNRYFNCFFKNYFSVIFRKDMSILSFIFTQEFENY